jgi:hypothetical protein
MSEQERHADRHAEAADEGVTEEETPDVEAHRFETGRNDMGRNDLGTEPEDRHRNDLGA